jgi:hypothetical protein
VERASDVAVKVIGMIADEHTYKLLFVKIWEGSLWVPWESKVCCSNERRKRKTTSKGQPKNRAKAKQECEEGKRETRNENGKHRSWSMMMKRKSPENVASIEKKTPSPLLRGKNNNTAAWTSKQKSQS